MTEYCLSALLAVIFFSAIFGLCPIKGFAKKKESGKNTTAVEKKLDKNLRGDRKKSKESGKAHPDKEAKGGGADSSDDTLYKYEKPTVAEQSYAWTIIKTILVLGLLAGGFYYFFRFLTRRAGVPLGADIAQVLSMIPVGQNKFIQIIDLAGKVLVLGVTDHSINLIMEIKDKEEIDRIRLAGSKAAVIKPGGFQEFFSQQIGKFLKKRTVPREFESFTSHEETEVDRLRYLAMQKERLKKMSGLENE